MAPEFFSIFFLLCRWCSSSPVHLQIVSVSSFLFIWCLIPMLERKKLTFKLMYTLCALFFTADVKVMVLVAEISYFGMNINFMQFLLSFWREQTRFFYKIHFRVVWFGSVKPGILMVFTGEVFATFHMRHFSETIKSVFRTLLLYFSIILVTSNSVQAYGQFIVVVLMDGWFNKIKWITTSLDLTFKGSIKQHKCFWYSLAAQSNHG